MIVERISRELGLPQDFVLSLARAATFEYKEYGIPKHSGGFRIIHHPSKRLKALQRWLLANVLEQLPVHKAAAAYRKRLSIFDNARSHANSRYLLRVDFTDFFPSIRRADIAKYIYDRKVLFSDWTAIDVEVVTGLVCRKGVLTIGAPTSPAVSNVLCYDLDAQLEMRAAKNEITYTRYADDLFFSTVHKGVLQGFQQEVFDVVEKLEIPANLKINVAKTRHSSKRRARRVTGIILGSDGRPHIGRAFKRKIRSLVHKFDSLDEPTKASLQGMLAYAGGFDPDFINSLIMKYGLKAIRTAKGEPAPVGAA